MHVGKVRDIKHVVVDKLIVAAHVKCIRSGAGPLWMRGPPPVGNQRRIDFSRIAHPHPDPVPTFQYGIGTNASIRWNMALSGNFIANSPRIEFQAVIAATQIIAHHYAQGQLRMTMTAAILQRHRRAVRAPIKNNRLVHDGAGEGLLARYLAVPRCHVPRVAKKHFSRPWLDL